MTSLKNYQRKINQYKINRLNYGDLYICGNDIRCGTCLNDWNYQWEIEDINYIRPLLQDHSIGIDVGAHIGMYSIALKEKFDKMYSFEPDLCSYEALQKNSGLYSHIIPFNFFVDGKEKEGIPLTISLDAFFVNNFFIDFIKIDVDGQEIRILKGAKNLIEYNDNLVMLIEFKMNHLLPLGYTDKDFFNALYEVGLDCNDTYKKLKPLITDKFITNLIITKKEKIVSSHYISYYN